MTSVLTKEEADRGPIRQLKASRTTVYDKIRDSMNNLSDVELRQMQLETEREYQIGETRSKFDEEFASIDEDVASGMKELEESWQSLNEINLPLEFQAELEKLMKETDAIVAKKLEFIQQLENEVRTRDHEYVNKTADYRKMIDTFVHTMRQQESDLKEAMAAEMTKIREAFNEEYLNGLNANFALYDGVADGIKKFKDLGIKMAVVTNKAEMFARPLIGYMGFNDCFDFVLGGEVIKERKPDPFPLLYVCQKLNVDPHAAVMVGDSDNDVLAGQRADMVTVAFTYGYNSGKDVRNCHPDYVFDKFDDFTALILSLKNKA